jgi:hypothetical protein
MAGQQLFYPPNVAGWDDTRWLDTATWRGRWWIAQAALDPYALDPDHTTRPYDATKLLASALGFWHSRRSERPRARRSGRSPTARSPTPPAPTGKKQAYPPMVTNALRQLIAVSPELQAA